MRTNAARFVLIALPFIILMVLGMMGGRWEVNKTSGAETAAVQQLFLREEGRIEEILNEPKQLAWLFDWADSKHTGQAIEGALEEMAIVGQPVFSIVRQGKIIAWTSPQVIAPEKLINTWSIARDSIFIKPFTVNYQGKSYEVLAQFVLPGKYLTPWQAERTGKLASLTVIKDKSDRITGYLAEASAAVSGNELWPVLLIYLLAYVLIFAGSRRILHYEHLQSHWWKGVLVLLLPLLLRGFDHLLGVGNYVDRLMPGLAGGRAVFGGITGHLLIVVFAWLQAVIYFSSLRRVMIRLRHTAYGDYKLAALFYALNFIGLFLVLLFCKVLVVNSGVAFDFNNLLNLSRLSLLFIILLAVMLINLFLCSYQLSREVNFFKISFRVKIISVSIAAVICLPLLLTAGLNLPVHIFLLLLLLYALIFDIFIEVRDPTLGWLVIWIIFYSAFAAVALFKFNRDREGAERLAVAAVLSNRNDEMLLSKMNEIILQLKNNKQIYPRLSEMIRSGDADGMQEIFRTVISKDNYLTDYYDFSFAIATGGDKWVGRDPIYQQYVRNKNHDWQKQKHYLFALHPAIYHGGIIKFYWTSGEIEPVPECYILVEKKNLIPRASISNGSRGFLGIRDLNKFDYAIYKNGRLMESQGTYYPDKINIDKLQFKGKYSERNISHRSELIVNAGDGQQLIVGRELSGLIKPVSLFSFIYVLILLLVIGIALINSFIKFLPDSLPMHFSKNINLRQRIEYSIILVIVFSFGAIAYVTSVYFRDLSYKMEQQQINEKSFALVSDIEHKLRSNRIDSVTVSTLMDLRRSHQIDYTLFSLAGDRIFSTDNNSEDIIKMDPAAFVQLGVRGNPFYFDIGGDNQQVSRSYMPIRNNVLDKVAWLEIPVSSGFDRNFFGAFDFLGTLLNVYVFLLLMAGAIAIVIANSITKPIVKLVENVRKIRLGKKNEIIHWDKEDEIGVLIKEYNKMIGQLESSAEILARSERESAWREMARQVAHEIKNPLTPMRLSAQYLVRKVEGKTDPEVEEAIRNTSQTLIEQIDNLATIATEFSNFAVMPAPVLEYINLSSLVASVYDLFRKQEEVAMHFSEPIDDIIVSGDRSHLIRLMNNLIKNAIQSIPHGTKGKIRISLEQEGGLAYIRVKDNGIGIPDEMREKVFSPNFTTKSSGMGLGLALSKSIVETFGGQIHFDSVAGGGTEFIVTLPVADTSDLIPE